MQCQAHQVSGLAVVQMGKKVGRGATKSEVQGFKHRNFLYLVILYSPLCIRWRFLVHWDVPIFWLATYRARASHLRMM